MKADVETPIIHELMTYKGIHALCTTNKEGKVLKTTHWACLLIGGRNPVWGVWLVDGRFLRFYSYRSQIEAAYPKLVWRKKMATWQCMSVEDKTIERRRRELEHEYGVMP